MFDSSWSCSCQLKFGEHKLVVETREERESQGRFVSEAEGIMRGNLQNFMDLADYSDKFESKVD